MFKRNDIILVPFPFTDLSSNKLRPALVISDTKFSNKDAVVAFVSSNIKPKTEISVNIKKNDPDFLKTGLKKDSTILLNKISTLDKNIVLGKLGSLSKKHIQEVNKALKKALKI